MFKKVMIMGIGFILIVMAAFIYNLSLISVGIYAIVELLISCVLFSTAIMCPWLAFGEKENK